MAPARARDPSIERTSEYEEFMRELEAYHETRGTTLEREPKIANRHLDLLRLYNRVCNEGGYDVVSDTKGNKLAWRRLASEFLPSTAQLMTQAFLVKTAYYKNLAAYEISKFHKKEPPPREILEDVTAKGGNLLNRTLENFARPTLSRDVSRLANGVGDKDTESDGSDDGRKSSGPDKMDVDEPTSASGRITRALRHAPPQRVLFQPESSSPRAARHTSTHASSPAPTPLHSYAQLNGTATTNGATITIASYEPKPQIPSAVKPVPTPGNNPEHFRQLREKLLASSRLSKQLTYPRGIMLPGTGYNGPGIYHRALLALQSGTPTEQEYALHHLVKISHERGDKYRFIDFAGLAEALIAKTLEVTSLFYEAAWEISYAADEGASHPHQLNALYGTPDLLEKIRQLRPLDTAADDVHPEAFSHALGRVNEAALVIRNMVMLEQNAELLSRRPLIRDLITVVLNLPPRIATLELKHYSLEIAEQLTKYFSLDAQDPLYRSLVAQLDSQDRGCLVVSFRAIARIAMNLEISNRLPDIPGQVLQRINDWLLVEDEELRNACLDFLYQFTAITDNVELLLRSVNMDALIGQLVRLLLYNAVLEDRTERSRPHNKSVSMPNTPPRLSSTIVQQLLQHNEPERSSHWLRTSFVEEPMAEMTQVALWKAYQDCFQEFAQTRPTLSAKDFITNVSATFPSAVAHVLPGPKYVIRGVRSRDVAIDQRGRPYLRCQWHLDRAGNECGEYSVQAAGMWEHILTTHLLVKKRDDGKFVLDDDDDDTAVKSEVKGEADGDGDVDMDGDKPMPPPRPLPRRFTCHWGGCRHFASTRGSTDARMVSQHIQTHLPDSSAHAAQRAKHHRDPDGADEQARPLQSRVFLVTQTDERNDAAGLPLAAVLVLRNLARQLAKVEPPPPPAQARRSFGSSGGSSSGGEEEGWVPRLFAPVKEQLYHVMAYNIALREYIASLTRAIAAGGG